jgi:hypothetical protein
MGFWGLQKVIERHAVTPGQAKNGNLLYLQSEPTRTSDTLYLGGACILGSSGPPRVLASDLATLEALIEKHSGKAPLKALNWNEWKTTVETHRPNLLIALAHTGGTGSKVTLEIGGTTKRTITFTDNHIFPPPIEGHQAPLLALIGCDTTGTASDYGNHVEFLRAHGAGIVIGTIATVFGGHAAEVAGQLVEGLLASEDSKTVRLGELIRTIRRKSLRKGLLMPLCLVAYGDADWILSPKRANDA